MGMGAIAMRDRLARSLAAFGAVIGWAALTLQFVLLARTLAAEGGGLPLAAWRFLGFFTILTNIVAAAAMTQTALRYERRAGLAAPRGELAAATAIGMVGLVYTLLLRATWDPKGLQKFADIALHDATPLVALSVFLLRRRPALRIGDVGFALVMPVGYVVYALARGAIDGWYAYYFLDPRRMTASQMALNIVGLAVAFLVLAFALRWASNLLCRREEGALLKDG